MSKKTNQLQKSPLSFALAFLLGVCLCVSPLLAGCANNATTSTASTTESTAAANTTESTTEATATETTTSASAESTTTEKVAFDNDKIDYSVTFPSWQKDSASLKELVDFVKAATDESSADYVAPEDRIATFDMDGTIICEKGPFYADWCMLLNRVLDNPSYNEASYKPTDEAKKQCQEIRDAINAGEKPSEEMEANKARMIASEFKGLTPEEFRTYAKNFAESVDTVGFKGMTYAESFYKPMIEVMKYLQDNDFTLWMISACEREFVRGIVPSLSEFGIDIPLEHIVGTDVAYAAADQGEDAYDKHNMKQGENIVMSEPLGQETAKAGKPIAIEREIGKRPILSFGNSSGDYAMLNYAQSNPDHKGRGILVLCDDTIRAHGDAKRAAEQTEEAEKEDWILFHMSDKDWATIYGESVTRVEYPGAAEETAELAQAA